MVTDVMVSDVMVTDVASYMISNAYCELLEFIDINLSFVGLCIQSSLLDCI